MRLAEFKFGALCVVAFVAMSFIGCSKDDEPVAGIEIGNPLPQISP